MVLHALIATSTLSSHNIYRVFFHNLREFDSHLLMQGIGVFKRRHISVISNNMERYVSFSLGSLRFLDSYQFLQSSLSDLVDDLNGEDSKHFK